MNTPAQEPAAVSDILLEISIEAPMQKVWDALVNNTAAWWQNDFCAGQDVVGFHVQPKLGGWMYEDWGDGNGLIWGIVNCVNAPKTLQVVGDSSPAWGGPNRGIMEWDLSPLESNAEHTMVRFRHSAFGKVTSQTIESWTHGWNAIFAEAFKAHLEAGA